MTTTQLPAHATTAAPGAARATAHRPRTGLIRRITVAGIATAVAAMTFTGIATPAFAGAETNTLHQNEQLNPGQRLITSNGIALVMQRDGNLVEYAPGNRAVWSSNTNRADSILRMQGDGNLVIIAPGNVSVWSTRTNGNPGAGLELQTDGNAVVYAQGHIAKWSNGVRLDTGGGGGGGGSLGQRVIDTARAQAGDSSRNTERGGYNCNYYSRAINVSGGSCSNGWRTQEWCADFAHFVWRQAGARTANLDAAAASFYRYGDANRTWRTGNPRVGDAVVFGLNSNRNWARHVGIVTAVHANGQITTVEGNAGPNTDRVHTATFTPTDRGVSGYTSPVS